MFIEKQSGEETNFVFESSVLTSHQSDSEFLSSLHIHKTAEFGVAWQLRLHILLPASPLEINQTNSAG